MSDPIRFRGPAASDAADVWRLARDSGALDLNSPYAYLLWCTDFATTTVLAEDATDRRVGFVGGYRPPTDPEAAFVWQVAVAADQRGRGLGRRLLDAFLSRPGTRDGRWLTATVTPSNAASLALFRGYADARGVGCDEHERFPAEVFPAEAGVHEPELALRIGPLPPR
ncbi:diaminobutyrate acetyltransferase [Egicoccus halophilus]|uniref:L-2,4-diaminobutyric acid acetyltransferase n=1 Tax=Egicoccus halophilus TaxID=1670830 RepID=A0A8J3EUQ7_9ACTN|nr:diaminobutyrate acetyltransferase [Egicoccus halophilus]GGI06424.1 L-2,4-diaminobutyric acid acetyltransferase [Egicoccus halophilus]